MKGFDCIFEYFPLSTCLTVLSTVSATNGGQTGAAAGHVELVAHARVVRRFGARQHKVLQVESADQDKEGERPIVSEASSASCVF